MRELAFERGIQPAAQYYPLYRYSLFADFGYGVAEVPQTDAFFDNMVSLPFHVWMTDSDFAYVLDQVRDVALGLRVH
jgi:dTDP-4-amino-4,6-dideoxygalactose transaminase